MPDLSAFLSKLELPQEDSSAAESQKRFPDGAQYRVEIPSVEGPKALAAVLDEAKKRKLKLHRVSQGSGIMLLSDTEIKEMAQMGADNGMEVSLFVGPRAAWDTGAQITASAGKNLGARLRGINQVRYATEDIFRAVELGIRSVLIADEGQLWLVNELKKAGELPSDLVLKISVQMGASNPISVKLMEEMGAGTYNVPTDLSVAQLAAIRQVVNLPIDMYVEVPDDFGGFVRYYELAELIKAVSPIYVKLGLRNSPNIYPSGYHIEDMAVKLCRERVRRAQIALDMIARTCPEATMSEPGAKDLGIPVIA
ncbi:MAG: U32 family peptidase [Trueperaceae bacterium]|nr:U32 family peptidase [Trueperaceae bacterium]